VQNSKVASVDKTADDICSILIMCTASFVHEALAYYLYHHFLLKKSITSPSFMCKWTSCISELANIETCTSHELPFILFFFGGNQGMELLRSS